MSTFIHRQIEAPKKDTISGNVPGTISSDEVAVYTAGLFIKNSVSIRSRFQQLFNALRDSNRISADGAAINQYATMSINGSEIIFATNFIGMSPGEVRVGIGSAIKHIGSAILERAVFQTYDWGNENDKLVTG